MNINELRWEEKFKLARKYYKKYGHLIMPSHFITSNGTTYNKNGIRLGEWVSRQKAIYNHSKDKMPIKHIKKLESIGMVWGEKIESENSPLAKKWNEMYQLAIKYKEHYQDSNIPIEFKTLNGIDFDENGLNLGYWYHRNLSTYNKYLKGLEYPLFLNENRIQKLESLISTLSMRVEIMNNRIEMLSNFKKHYGHCNIPLRFRTTNGIDFDENGFTLGLWINDILKNKKNISKEHKEKIENLNVKILTNHDKIFDTYFSLAQNFYKHHKHLNIPQNFITTNGYEYDEKGIKLGLWLHKKRSKYSMMLKNNEEIPAKHQEKITCLQSIGLIFSISDKNWDEMYQLAKNFYEENGHLQVTENLITSDGIHYDSKGKNLSCWIKRQRIRYFQREDGNKTLNEKQIDLLNQIGMIWDYFDNYQKTSKISEKYKLYHKRNLCKINARELQAKIRFMKANKIPLLINEELNGLFFMSSKNIQAKYGITLEELVNTYTPKKQK